MQKIRIIYNGVHIRTTVLDIKSVFADPVQAEAVVRCLHRYPQHEDYINYPFPSVLAPDGTNKPAHHYHHGEHHIRIDVYED